MHMAPGQAFFTIPGGDAPVQNTMNNIERQKLLVRKDMMI
ncbi:hypothetical protein LMG3431_03903 [Achromobacter pestifer]|uniref:Uncharacterized protein n=1 Tax=Achromobacter pestifer TaxID=1353889 RepID=A0A6S6ZFP7_9BURK|nr:hypothetical protein LMG3431_03903 [Achromobacter pestifer]